MGIGRGAKLRATVLLVPLLLLCGTTVTSEEVPYRSYVYDVWGNSIAGPHAYDPRYSLSGFDLGVGPLRNPSDLQITETGLLLIADTGNDRVVVYDLDAQALVTEITGFASGNGMDRFSGPEGVYSESDDGTLYIADTGNRRIVVLGDDGALVSVVEAPDAEVIREDYDFVPAKVAADAARRLYAVGPGMFEGVMEFDQTGEFQGFLGSNRVTLDPWEWFMRQISSEEQRERMRLFIPEEFSNIDIDEDGFIYAVTSEEDSELPVKRINFLGLEILKREGYFPPQGDVDVTYEPIATQTGPSMLTDVCIDAAGMYMVLDSKRGRIFGYDEEGHLLYVFGGTGSQTGTFVRAAALDTWGDAVFVLDRVRGDVTVFSPTEYGQSIREAVMFHWRGDYDMAAFTWQEVLGMNQHLAIAHTGVGKALLRNHRYEEALEHFRLGNDRTYYSKALKKLRRQRIRAYFGTFMTMLLVAVVGYFVGTRIYRRYIRPAGGHRPLKNADTRFLPQLGYSFHVLGHPFDGYYDLRFAHGGNLGSAATLFAAFVAVLLAKYQFTGFVFLNHDVETMNLFLETARIVAPVMLFVVSNWTVTSILDGKGNLRDIFIATMYALVPVILVYPFLTFVSNALIQEEEAFYRLLEVAPIVWSAFLLFIGSLTIHQYSLGKTAGTLVLTVVTMAIILFLLLLLVTFLEQVMAFIIVVYRELRFRI